MTEVANARRAKSWNASFLVHFGRVTLAHGAVTRSPELISRSKAKGLGQMINMLQLNGWASFQ